MNKYFGLETTSILFAKPARAILCYPLLFSLHFEKVKIGFFYFYRNAYPNFWA